MRTKTQTDRARSGTSLTQVATYDLDAHERDLVVGSFIKLLEDLYAHLPLKRAMYGIDPVQQLRRLRQRLETLDEAGFHHELGDIIRSLRDAHTVYVGPESLAGHVARLPFLIETYGLPSDPHYMVSKVAQGMVADDQFTEGVELEWWNGMPIATAIDVRARHERGGRPDSGRARAIESLTFRPLRYEPPPDERWVEVGYRTNTGAERKVRIDWDVIQPGAGPEPTHPASPAAASVAINPGAADVRRAKKLMFNDELWRREIDAPSATVTKDETGNIVGRFQDNVSARVVDTKSGTYGHLRLWGFDLSDDDGFVAEVAEILAMLPQDGLIIDLRANPGGLIWAAERLLQLFTPHPVEPTRFSLLATDATEILAAAPQNQAILGQWLASLRSARATGELYSQGLPITPVGLCNDIGQIYGGPVVGVVDATTYSAGDLFAAGFVDNEIGTLVAVGEATGAGGANVWNADILAILTAGTQIEYRRLPAGIGFTISIRRATRVRASAGTPIEDIGVRGHRHYAPTRTDLLQHNRDLLDYCGEVLASTTHTNMTVTTNNDTLTINTENLSTVNIYADGRPTAASIPVTDNSPFAAPLPFFAETLEVKGYKGAALKQRRVVHTGTSSS